MTEFARLGDEPFVSLTTFRRSGEPVSTPVWIARDGDALIVTTPEESGKVKRLRNNESVELRPCSRRGKVDARVDPVAAVAEIVTDESASRRMADTIRDEYGLEYRIVMFIERVLARRRKPRVLLRITPATERVIPTSS
ncbi:PPOX class F420-dependent oxidoreductase [Rhodococcus pseudokoreensis]|uniref:PPOX class F420-dependent oxidoreductase n=1 Tax=Rhodococcus pseudokoreensis TaxID=2811421 RepID=A0A974WAM4_9NOCA|nr:PPOX class F420-dependent oxidoreductase [Rhodococcus pseudokoreensis]QSE93650.1 PPOX class F420-dependent oxidoreductase [Rhodococcus pseudokoreensis]